MVQQINANRLGGFTELPGDLDVSAAGSWVTARMIVSGDDRRGALEDRVAENFERMYQQLVAVPIVTIEWLKGLFLRSRQSRA